MPIKIPNDLPAVKVLTDENIFVMTENRAISQDIRPLKILLLNLMPKKIETETQFSRLLGNTPLQVELELIHTKSHKSKNVAEEHLLAFYKTFDEIKENYYDGFIITGAPVEQMEFEELFENDSSTPEIVTTFQALLELLKHQFLLVEQEELFSKITIKKNPNKREDEEIGEIDEYN